MKTALVNILFLALLIVSACSLPPERLVTKEELYKTGIYNMYTIKESPDRVLAALNSEGEVVLEVLLRKEPYYVKILATTEGLKIYATER